MKLVPVTYFGFTAMDRRFSSPMLPWIVSEIKKRDYSEKLSMGVEEGIIQAYNQDFELQFSHKVWQITRFSQADQDSTTFLYVMRDDPDTLLYCYLFQAKRGSDVLHVIDRVLDPMTTAPFYNPTAMDVLNQPTKWKIGAERIAIFTNKVKQHGQEKLFYKGGGHTFFVPVDFKMDEHKIQTIDSYIIQGHVVPDQVLFTRPCEKDFIFETAANGDFVYIVLSITENGGRYFVRSYTVVGNSSHRKGELLVEIVKANIPVANGVVHLISQPLAVFDRELKPFPYLPVLYKISVDPYLDLMYQAGEKVHFNQLLQNDTVFYTYFAVRDRNWGRYFDQASKNDIWTTLSTHVVVATQRYSMSSLWDMSKDRNGIVLNTLAGPIVISVTKANDSYWITRGRTQIRVYRPDYECSDGVVHVLDEPLVNVGSSSSSPTTNRSTFWGALKKMV